MVSNVLDYQKNLIRQSFLDKERFLFCMERIHTSNVFADKSCQLFWKVFIAIYKDGGNICTSTVHDVLRQSQNDFYIDEFDQVVQFRHPDEGEWEYHLHFIQEQYKKRVLLQNAQWTISNITKSSTDISAKTHETLAEIDSITTKSVPFNEAYRNAISVIRDIHEGKIRPMLSTGQPKLDHLLSISESRYVLVAAQKKIGKSRWMVDLIDKIINCNKNVAIQWYSFEMPSDEMIRCFISRKVSLTDREMMSKGKSLTESEVSNMEAAFDYFEKYPIEFIDEPCDMFQIASKFERFSESNEGKHCICVIDNMGLIKPHINDQNAFEDDIARIVKSLRDKTKGTIFMLHHLTKESESKWNKESGYEPKIGHIRGSSRIVDFANQVVLLHRPDNYPDLVELAQRSGKLSSIEGLFVVSVAANRDGEMGDVLQSHEIKYCRFNER